MLKHGHDFEKELIEETLKFQKWSRKNCEGKTFKLVGVTNPLCIFPGFAMPIFVCEQDGKEYAQEGSHEHLTLNSFYETEPYADLSRVKYLDSIEKNELKLSCFTIDSNLLLAFQISENKYFFGFPDEMKSFLRDYKTDSRILAEKIEYFLSCG